MASNYNVLKKISPVAFLPGGCLLIIASGKLAHAVTVVGALAWVYGFTSLVIYTAAKIFPQRGRTWLFFFLASFMAGCYLFALWLFSPFCAIEIFFAVSLVPVFYMVSGVSGRPDVLNGALRAADSFFSSFFEAFSLGVLLLAVALIREPLGFVSLSLPGGAQGSVMLFSFNVDLLLPVQLIASSGGVLLLLGYFWGLYNFMNKARGGNKNAR